MHEWHKRLLHVVVPDMIARFEKIAGHVAGFYAARLAHITKFGLEE